MDFKKALLQTNLTPSQAEILEYLYQNKEAKASEIAKRINRSRAIVYKEIEELAKFSLIERKDKPGQATVFLAGHPAMLEKLMEKREAELKKDRELLSNYLPDMVSSFNLINNRPGVRYYEGLEGIKKVLDDTLESNPEKKLLTFSDVAGYAKYLEEWNTKIYAPKRKRLGVFEKVIIPNNQGALDYMKGYKANEVTEILFIDHTSYPFKTEINIYNNKVSFVTFSDKALIGVIVESEEINTTLSSVFNFVWELGKKHCADSQPEWLKNIAHT